MTEHDKVNPLTPPLIILLYSTFYNHEAENGMDWYIKVWKEAFNFTGRARRTEYWTYTLLNAAIMITLIMFAVFAIGTTESRTLTVIFMVIGGLFYAATIIPSISVTIRRLHDIGVSGLWLLIILIPPGGLIILVITFIDGQPMINKWGPSPKLEHMDVEL